MKRLVVACSFALIASVAMAQHAKELEPGYYVVVAAFSPHREDLAINFTNELNKRGIKTQYGFNSVRNYYYVYTSRSQDRKTSYNEMMEKRKQEEFAKTWVWVVKESVNSRDALSMDPDPCFSKLFLLPLFHHLVI